MPDREKVISGLEYIKELITFDLFTGEEIEPENLNEANKKMYDAFVGAIALLKEQDAVKRTYRTGINGFSIIWTCGACGSDLYPNNAKAKYCSNCGQAVKWE